MNDNRKGGGPTGPLAAVAILIILYLLAAVIEPCDGHSCANDSKQTEVQQ